MTLSLSSNLIFPARVMPEMRCNLPAEKIYPPVISKCGNEYKADAHSDQSEHTGPGIFYHCTPVMYKEIPCCIIKQPSGKQRHNGRIQKNSRRRLKRKSHDFSKKRSKHCCQKSIDKPFIDRIDKAQITETCQSAANPRPYQIFLLDMKYNTIPKGCYKRKKYKFYILYQKINPPNI